MHASSPGPSWSTIPLPTAYRSRTHGDVCAGDLLVTEAGTLKVPERFQCLPGPIWAQTGDARFAAGAALLNPGPNLIMGCVYSSLLTVHEGLEPVTGLPTPSQTAAAWDLLERLGAGAAPVSLQGQVVADGILVRMRQSWFPTTRATSS